MRALDTQQSLVINCLCIYDITCSLSEWEQSKETRNSIWDVQNVFTSEYRSKIFRSPHNTQECSVFQRIYISRNNGNADIINFIDAIYVKT